jgi:hypothetical protein
MLMPTSASRKQQFISSQSGHPSALRRLPLHTPNTAICAAFWLSVIWVIRSTRLIRYGGGFTILLGVVLNALVTEFNDGVMPVLGMPLHFQTAAPIP